MDYIYGPDAIKKMEITIYNSKPFNKDFETIERKGLGHPDTIADAIAANISLAYSRYTLKNCDNLILHHQIDKVMVIGGKTEVSYGKGRFVEPIKIIVAGRASGSYKEKIIPIDKITTSTIREYFNMMFPDLKYSRDYLIQNNLTSYPGPGTILSSKGAIASMFAPKNNKEVRGYEKLVANDTSYCVAYAPYSNLESTVLTVENFLNQKSTKHRYPWLGTDIKIMAIRDKKNISITMCIPQIAKHVESLEIYKKNLNQIGRLIYKKFTASLPGNNINLSLNTKDDYEKMNVYLTVTGSSLSGDIGVSGRGNRTNGLITSNRPMSLEGTNGKNPRYYSGFIYAVLTKKLSKEIFQKTGKANIIEMVSQNGAPLKDPWKVRVISDANKSIITKIIKDGLKNISSVTDEFINGNNVNF